MVYRCAHCNAVFAKFIRYSKHLRQFHEYTPGFHVICKIDGCMDVFTTVRYFVNHVNKKHKQTVAGYHDRVLNAEITAVECDADASPTDMNESIETVEPAGDDIIDRPSLAKIVNNFELQVARCVLKLRERHILPAIVQQDIVDEMQLLVTQTHDTYRSLFTTFCREQNLNSDSTTSGMSQFLNCDTSVFSNAFTGIANDYKLNKYISDNFVNIKPTEILFSKRLAGKPVKFSYISIGSVLELMLANDDIRDLILSCNNVVPSSDRLSSFLDGSIYREHSLFSEYPSAIRLHFYLDEFEVCNPLGSKRGKHKVLAVYYFVGNLESKYWSEMKFIHLCILVRYRSLRECDPQYVELLKPLIEELNMLASVGVNVKAYGVTYNFRAGLATISGDNLSAHSLAGFQCHFNSGRICRFCMASYDEIGVSFREDNYVIRNKEVHAYHLEALRASEANGPVYGVISKCPLLDLNYFDVSSVFAPDIMHDLLECVIPNVMLKIIQKTVRDKTVTLDMLNTRLRELSRGINDCPNAFTPRILTSTGSIVGSASQKWQLFLMFPRLIGTYIEKDDASWEVYLILHDVTDYVFAPVINRSSLSYLEGLVIEFLTAYTSVFCLSSLQPKFHYMIHYPRLISMYGPLRHLWCMRFESKHQYFKSVISSLGNYINVTSTMACRHQMRQCWEFTSPDILQCNPLSLAKTRIMPISHLPSDLRSVIATRLRTDIAENELINTTSKLLKDHVTYSVDSCLICSVVEQEEIPVYFQVKQIVLFRDTWLLCGRLCFCDRFYRHLHAFSVNIDDGWFVIYPGEEVDYNTHDFFVLNGCSFVSSKYNVPADV